MRTLAHTCARCGLPVTTGRYSFWSSLCWECANEAADEAKEIARQVLEDAETLKEDLLQDSAAFVLPSNVRDSLKSEHAFTPNQIGINTKGS